MPTANDFRPKPKPTRQEQTREVLRRPQVVTWFLGSVMFVAVLIVSHDPYVGVVGYLAGSAMTWAAGRVR
jgi:hypothetical protein